jgi:hypothetical protein
VEAARDVSSGKKMGSGERCITAIILATGSLDDERMNEFYDRLVQELQLKDPRPFTEVATRFLKGGAIESKTSWDGRWLGFASVLRETALIPVLNVDVRLRSILVRFLEIVAKEGGQVLDIVGANFLKHYDALPQDVPTAYDAILAGARVASYSFINAIIGNFNMLPVKTQDRPVELLLASKDEVAHVATRIVEHYDALPVKMRRLLTHFVDESKYFEYDEIPHTNTGGIAQATIKNYDRLPDEVCSILTVLTNKDENTAKSIPWILVNEYCVLSARSREDLGRMVKVRVDLSKWALVYFADECYEDPDRSIELILALLEDKATLKRFVAEAVLDLKHRICATTRTS